MSAQIETLIICDGPRCGAVYANGDARYDTAARQRKRYKLDDWHRSENKDWCPECWKARKASRSNGQDDRCGP